MKKITIVVPCYNEEEGLKALFTRLTSVLSPLREYIFNYLFINDGSTDGTLGVIKELQAESKQVSYISLSRNFGKEAAMLAGLDYAEGDAVVIMDADLQHPPELIPKMLKYWEEGYDDICAKRSNRENETFIKRHLTKVFYYFLKMGSRVPVQQNVGDFRLLDRRCVAALCLMREEQRYTKGMFTWVGYKKKEISYEPAERTTGKTAWNYMALSNLAIEGITSFTTAPLRITTLLGFIASIGAMTYMIVVLFCALLYGDPVAGYPTLITVILFLGGVQLLSLGIIGEYLGRVFNESKHRPIYLIDEKDGKKMYYDRFLSPVEKKTASHIYEEDKVNGDLS